jgi:glycosyltransferase involved in cell wall biosynthesis
LASFTDSLAVGLSGLGILASHVVRTFDESDAVPPVKPVPHAVVVGDLVANRASNPLLVDDCLQDCDIVIVQHEFGIFGGADGAEVIPILEALHKPTIVVLHTVLERPTDNQKFIVERVSALATAVVVMTTTALGFLLANYAVDARKVELIPHGVPVQPAHSLNDAVRPGTILTWGLMGPGKGIEWGIMALALLQDSRPDLTYTVIGQTHPKVFERDGHQYREMLARLAQELGVGDRVMFDDQYLGLNELGSRVRQSEIVLLPYDARNQVTSGVLVEALAAEKLVVSTAFPHAIELLADGVGEVVKHESPRDIAEAIERLLSSERAPKHLTETAQPGNDANSWPQVAQQFLTLADTRVSRAMAGLS